MNVWPWRDSPLRVRMHSAKGASFPRGARWHSGTHADGAAPLQPGQPEPWDRADRHHSVYRKYGGDYEGEYLLEVRISPPGSSILAGIPNRLIETWVDTWVCTAARARLPPRDPHRHTFASGVSCQSRGARSGSYARAAVWKYDVPVWSACTHSPMSSGISTGAMDCPRMTYSPVVWSV